MRGQPSERMLAPAPEAKKNGALAQLGEHLLCKQRVIGSIPIGSTNYQDREKHRFPSTSRSEFHIVKKGCFVRFIHLNDLAGNARVKMSNLRALTVRLRIVRRA